MVHRSQGGTDGTKCPLKHSKGKLKQESVSAESTRPSVSICKLSPGFIFLWYWAFQIWLKLKMVPSWCIPADCIPPACSVCLYPYFVLYRTRGVFGSLMTVLILFISEKHHPGHAVDRDWDGCCSEICLKSHSQAQQSFQGKYHKTKRNHCFAWSGVSKACSYKQ